MAELNLEELSQRFQLTILPQEDPVERAHRHRQEWLATRVSQTLHGLLVVCALAGVGGIAWYCLRILIGDLTITGASPATTAEAQKWAMAILSAIVSGLIGFLTGRAVK
jgi:hypothetical protein